MKILGIDEAGRGPVIGPMVMCGYLIDDSRRQELRDMGVKDSKLLSGKKREAMYGQLKRCSDGCRIVSISASEIDSLRTIINLNKIEIEKMQMLINEMKPDVAIIDAPEANTKEFEKKVRKKVECECKIIAENFADRNHLEVGAASIVAKVARDREIRKLHRIHGNLGSGYSSDPVTISFLKNWLKMNKDFPDFVRKSWMTAQVMQAEKQQTKLGKFAR
jgi:ribonuclease HII